VLWRRELFTAVVCPELCKKCKYQHYFAFGLKPGRCRSGSKCKCLCEKVGTKCRRAKTQNYHLYKNQKVVRRFDYFGRFRQKCEIKVGAVDSAPVSTITNTGGDSAPVSSKLSHTDPKRSISLTEQMRQRGMVMCASMAREYRLRYRHVKLGYTMSTLKRWTITGDGGDPMPTYSNMKRGSSDAKWGQGKEDFAYKSGYTTYGEGSKMYIMVFVKVIGSIDGKRFVVDKMLVRAFLISCLSEQQYKGGWSSWSKESKACMEDLRGCYMNSKPKACKALVPKWKAIPDSQCKHFGFAMV